MLNKYNKILIISLCLSLLLSTHISLKLHFPKMMIFLNSHQKDIMIVITLALKALQSIKVKTQSPDSKSQVMSYKEKK